jgi:hypothetical protein
MNPGALLLVRTTDLLWQAGDVISPGQLVSGIHVLSTAIGLDLFSEVRKPAKCDAHGAEYTDSQLIGQSSASWDHSHDVIFWPPIQEYNLRLLTEDPDPYWVREWESKRGFAEALQRGLHEAQVCISHLNL